MWHSKTWASTDEIISEQIHRNKVQSKPVSKPADSSSGFVSFCLLPLRTAAPKSTCRRKVFYRPWILFPLNILKWKFTPKQLTPKLIKKRWVCFPDMPDRLQAVWSFLAFHTACSSKGSFLWFAFFFLRTQKDNEERDTRSEPQLKPTVLYSVFQENSLNLAFMNCFTISNICKTESGPLTKQCL